MERSVRRLVGILAVVFLLSGIAFSPVAFADDDLGECSSEFNAESQMFDWVMDAPKDMRDQFALTDLQTINYVTLHMYGDQGKAMFAEVLARQAGLPSTGGNFSETQEDIIAHLADLPKERLGMLQDLWMYLVEKYELWEELVYAPEMGATEQNDEPEPTPAPAAVRKPLTVEEADIIGEVLATRFGQDDARQQRELTEWFLSLPADDQSAVMSSVANNLDEKGREEFRTWLAAAYSSACPADSQGAPDTLNLRGEDWNALTIPGLPAPSQGQLKKTAEVDNSRAGRQVVLGQVTRETFDTWITQVWQEAALQDQSDADGKAFDNNFGPSFASGLQDSGGKAVTQYFQSDGGTEVRVDYLCTDQTLSVTVLDP